MKIEIKTENIVSITSENETDFENFRTKNSENNLKILFDISDLYEYFVNNEVLTSEFDDMDDLVSRVSETNINNIKGLESNYDYLSVDVEDASLLSDKNDIESLTSDINSEFKRVIDLYLGENLEIYEKKKNNEKDDELMINYQNEIGRIFRQKLIDEFGSVNYGMIQNSSFSIRRFKSLDYDELGFDNENSCSLKIKRAGYSGEEYRQNAHIFEKITNSPIVNDLEFVQRNNNSLVKIRLNEDTISRIKEIANDSSELFMSSPRYKEVNNDELFNYIGRVNDRKGNDADVYLLKSNNELFMVTDDKGYSKPESLADKFPELVELAKNKQLDISNKRKNKIRL